MKKIVKKKVDSLDFYKIFKPELTPKKMMELGVLVVHILDLILKNIQKPGFKKQN